MKFLLCFLLAVFVLGCSPTDPDEYVEPEKPKIAFEGGADVRFVGTWRTDDGVSTYVLAKDGTYKLDSKVKVAQRGTIDSHLQGEWKTNGDRMLFKDESGNVVPYFYDLKGDILKLQLTGSMKKETVLKRQ